MSADLYLRIIGACAVLSTLALLTVSVSLIKLVKRQLIINASSPINFNVDDLVKRLNGEQKENKLNGRIEVL